MPPMLEPVTSPVVMGSFLYLCPMLEIRLKLQRLLVLFSLRNVYQTPAPSIKYRDEKYNKGSIQIKKKDGKVRFTLIEGLEPDAKLWFDAGWETKKLWKK